MVYKVLASEVACNTIPTQVANNRVVRLVTNAAATRTVTLFDNPKPLQLTINASANGTTLLTFTANTGNTANLATTMRLVGSSNLAVVNTNVASEITAITNATAIQCNVDIIIQNGVCQIWATTTKTFTMVPNSEFVIEKGKNDFLGSNSTVTTEVLALPVSYKG